MKSWSMKSWNIFVTKHFKERMSAAYLNIFKYFLIKMYLIHHTDLTNVTSVTDITVC